MLTRLAYAGASILGLVAALVTLAPPSPDDPRGTWLVFLIGAVAFAAAAFRPALLAGPYTWIAAGGVAVLGLTAGMFASRTTICCAFVVSEQYGVPFPWTGKHAEYESLGGDGPPETFDEDAVWSVNGFNLVLDVAFWLYLAVAAVMLIQFLIRRVRSRPASV
jgi:hypothetical protein